MNSKKKKVVIIGAGPAGLTAAYELSKDDQFEIIVLEKSNEIGGLSRTVTHNGLRMDLGGHRFFSKSDKILNWWQQFMPIEGNEGESCELNYQGQTKNLILSKVHESNMNALMVRNRKSRILFLRKLFDYPLQFNFDTIKNIGLNRLFIIFISYSFSKLRFKKPKNLEDFFIKRFGKVLYNLFFKSYTEKVWGVTCHQISAEWGEQRIKKLSLTKSIIHLFKSKNNGISQKNIETSLIEKFLYPKLGPGQMWEIVASELEKRHVNFIYNACVVELVNNEKSIHNIRYTIDNNEFVLEPLDYIISSMPIKDLIKGMKNVPLLVRNVSEGLIYRDFIAVGILVNKAKTSLSRNKDNWIYIQESDVKLGRLQIFNNWSPYLVPNNDYLWLGLEYFCYSSDEIWNLTDMELIKFCESELLKLGLIEANSIEDSHIVRQDKSYPAYFGTYIDFHEIRNYIDEFSNLFLIGRNGMHRYNNQDHSMLTAIEASKQIMDGVINKNRIWEINTEQDYHETN